MAGEMACSGLTRGGEAIAASHHAKQLWSGDIVIAHLMAVFLAQPHPSFLPDKGDKIHATP